MPEVMLADPRLSLPLRRAWTAFAAVVAVYLVVLGAGWVTDGPLLPIDVHEGIQFLLMLDAAVLVLWRALTLREDRTAWLALGLGLAAWTAGQLIATLISPTGEEVPFPSAADAGLIVFYVGQYVAFFLLARSGLRRVPRADVAGRRGRHPAARRGRRALGVHAAPGRRRHGLGRRRDDRVPRRGHRPHGARDLRRRVAWRPSRRRLVADRRRRDADRARRRGVHAGIGRRHGAGHDDRAARDPLQHGRGLPRRGGAAAHAATAAADARRLARAGGPHRFVRRRAGPARARHGGHAHARRDGSADRRDRAHRRPRRHRVSREHRPGRQPPPGVDRRAHRPPQPPQRLRRARRSVRGGRRDGPHDRPRPLQGAQRHAGSPRRRRRARRGGAAPRPRAGRRRHAQPARRRRVRGRARTRSDRVRRPGRSRGACSTRSTSRCTWTTCCCPSGRASASPAPTRAAREELLRHADVAMYHAKANRNGVEVYASERDGHSRERLALAAELQAAITGGELVLHFQPKACLRTGRILGAEALVRWEHPERGLRPSGRVRAARRALRPRAAADARGDRPGAAHRARMARGRAARARGGEHLRRDAARRALPGRRRRAAGALGRPGGRARARADRGRRS